MITNYTPGQGIIYTNPNVRSVASRSLGGAPWYLAGGIALADLAGAWAAKGAASQDASYLRLAGSEGYADIDPAVVGGVAPGWDAVNGWQGTGLAYLKTGIIPTDITWSAIVKMTTSNIVNNGMPFGSRVSAIANTFYVMPQGVAGAFGNVRECNASPNDDSVNTGWYGNHSLGFAGNKSYRNGLFLKNLVQSAGVATLETYIMALNNNGVAAFLFPAAWYVSSIAFYKATISPAQFLSVNTAMP